LLEEKRRDKRENDGTGTLGGPFEEEMLNK